MSNERMLDARDYALGQRLADCLGLAPVTEFLGKPQYGWWNWLNGPAVSVRDNGGVRMNAFGFRLVFTSDDDGSLVRFEPSQEGREKSVNGRDLLWLVRLDHQTDGFLSFGLDRAGEDWLAAAIRCYKFHPGPECLRWKVEYPNNGYGDDLVRDAS